MGYSDSGYTSCFLAGFLKFLPYRSMHFTINTYIQNTVFTRFPPPKAELAAAESVTIELAEAVSIKARLTLFSR